MSTQFPNRRWLVIPTSITGSIDFNTVHENSLESLRLSVDGSKTFIKYEVIEVPVRCETEVISAETGEPQVCITEAGIYGRPSIYSEEYPEYNHEEILHILSTEEWTTPLQTLE